MTEMADRGRTVEALYRKYAGALFDHCFRLLGDQAAAEDALQEAFLSAYRGLSSFTYGESYLPWLYRIATNSCYKAMRTQRRKGWVLGEDVEAHPDSPGDPVNGIHAARILRRFAAELDERGFQIVVGYYLSGMTQDELAAAVGISRRAVVKRLTALRKKVGRLIERG